MSAPANVSAPAKPIHITLWKLPYDDPNAPEGVVVRAARLANESRANGAGHDTRFEVDFVDNNTNGWIEIDISGLTSANLDDPPETRVLPFRMIGNRFKSSSPDCERFIHDPLTELLEAKRTGNSQVQDVLRDVTEDTPVSTFVVNHDATLSNIHLFATVSH